MKPRHAPKARQATLCVAHNLSPKICDFSKLSVRFQLNAYTVFVTNFLQKFGIVGDKNRKNIYIYYMSASSSLSSNDTDERNRSCDGAVAQIHKIAYRVLYGDNNYTLESNDGDYKDDQLKQELIKAATHWAMMFNWPPPQPDGTRGNPTWSPAPFATHPDVGKNAVGKGYCSDDGNDTINPGLYKVSNERTCPGNWSPKKEWTNSICWICGTRIKQPPGQYQCEHIFNPVDQNLTNEYIAKANIPTGEPITSSALKNARDALTTAKAREKKKWQGALDRDDEWKLWLKERIKNRLSLLFFYFFGPSHTCCNQKKSQNHLFSIINGEFDQDTTKMWLKRIATDASNPPSTGLIKCDELNDLKTIISYEGGKTPEENEELWVNRRISQLQTGLVKQVGPIWKFLADRDLNGLMAVANTFRSANREAFTAQAAAHAQLAAAEEDVVQRGALELSRIGDGPDREEKIAGDALKILSLPPPAAAAAEAAAVAAAVSNSVSDLERKASMRTKQGAMNMVDGAARAEAEMVRKKGREEKRDKGDDDDEGGASAMTDEADKGDDDDEGDGTKKRLRQGGGFGTTRKKKLVKRKKKSIKHKYSGKKKKVTKKKDKKGKKRKSKVHKTSHVR